MLRKTHLLFAVFIYLLFIYLNVVSFSLVGLIIILVSTLISDIDSTTSKLGKKAKVISHSFKHRGFFHSILFGILIALLFYYYDSSLYIEFILGYFSHIVLDSFNYHGVYLLWPLRIKQKGFIKTNSLTEKLIRVFLLAVDIYLILMLLVL